MEDMLKSYYKDCEKRAYESAYKIGSLEATIELIYQLSQKNNYEDIIKIIERNYEVK